MRSGIDAVSVALARRAQQRAALSQAGVAELTAKFEAGALRGAAGLDGRHGKDGRHGIDGLDGKPGVDGADGKPGTDGKTGSRGPRGFDGIPGADGNAGARGLRGYKGEHGSPGPRGPEGPEGPEGPQGETGPMPKHEWRGSKIRFERAPGRWGPWTEVGGPGGVIARGGLGRSQVIALIEQYGGGSGAPLTVVTTAAEYSVAKDNILVLVDASAGDVPVHLPAATSGWSNVTIKKISTGLGNAVIDSPGTVEGVATLTLRGRQRPAVHMVADDAAGWWIA